MKTAGIVSLGILLPFHVPFVFHVFFHLIFQERVNPQVIPSVYGWLSKLWPLFEYPKY